MLLVYLQLTPKLKMRGDHFERGKLTVEKSVDVLETRGFYWKMRESNVVGMQFVRQN